MGKREGGVALRARRRCLSLTLQPPPEVDHRGSICTFINGEGLAVGRSVSVTRHSSRLKLTVGRSTEAKGTPCVRAQGGLPRAGTQTQPPLPRPTANGRTTSDGPAAEAARIGLRHSTRRRQQSRVETGRYGVAWLLMQQAVKLPPPSDAPFLPVSNFRPKEPARSHT